MNQRRGFQTNRTFVAPLSLYTTPPNIEISIEDFQQFAVDRLRGIPLLYPPTYRSASVLRILEEGRIARRPQDQVYENTFSVFSEAFSVTLPWCLVGGMVL